MNPSKLKKLARQKKDRIIDKNGYVLIYCPSNPFNKHGYVMEHRLILEEKIGRLLTPEETVHHINFIKSDNRTENLMLFPNQKEHQKFHNKIKQFGFTRPILESINRRWDNLVPLEVKI